MAFVSVPELVVVHIRGGKGCSGPERCLGSGWPRYLIYVHNFHIGNRRQYEGNISINNDPLHANEGSTDASRRQLQFGTINDVCYAKYQVPTRANVAFPEILRYIQVLVPQSF
jgi:hypothetical protein